MKTIQYFILSILFVLLSICNIYGQKITHTYQIQVASYAAPEFNNFKHIQKIGYVYSVPQANGIAKIMMGSFLKHSTAKSKLSAVKKKGYKDAFLVKTTLTTTSPVYIIQLATYDHNDDIYWSDWLRLSQNLVGQLSDKHLRVAIGPFYTTQEADAMFDRIQALGPKDMFIKKVSEKALHKINKFEFQKSSFYALNKGFDRHSVKALQGLLSAQNIYKEKENGRLTSTTKYAIKKFKQQNKRYARYQGLGSSYTAESFIEQYGLQYYINHIAKDPKKAAQGLQQMKHPMAKVYLAYLYLNKDIPTPNNSSINQLMYAATQQVFKNYRGKTRYDFSMKYHYEDLEQLLLHARSIYEVVKLRPDFPYWLFERHPETCTKVFAPYWNTTKDNYSVSLDGLSFLDIKGMRTLIAVSKDFASDERPIEQPGRINQVFTLPTPMKYQDIEALEKWNGKLWKSLKNWYSGSALQENMYVVLRFAYYDALQNMEQHFINKGLPGLEARALSLQVIKESVGCYLDDYCSDEKE